MISIARITDADIIKSITLDDSIWETIRHDGITKSEVEYYPNIKGDYYLGIYQGTILLGVVLIYNINNISCDCHINILPKYRVLSKDIGITILNTLIGLPYHKFIATVPNLYPNVSKYLEHFGFKQEGILTESISIDTILYDLIQYSSTKPQIIQYLNGVK